MSALQQNWDLRAALNFMLGGAGAGLLAACALLRQPDLPLMVGLGMTGAGLAAVWLEIGRKLRALHVLFNPRTSWMTRESYAALLLLASGSGSIFVPQVLPLAAVAALAFLYCQARILREAKGIPAWRAREVVPLVICTGLAEGLGLALMLTAEGHLALLLAAAVIARAIAWRRYRAVVTTAALAHADRALLQLGTIATLALAAASWLLPVLAPLAGIAAVAAGWQLKLDLVTRAAFKQEFTLPRLPVRGTR